MVTFRNVLYGTARNWWDVVRVNTHTAWVGWTSAHMGQRWAWEYISCLHVPFFALALETWHHQPSCQDSYRCKSQSHHPRQPCVPRWSQNVLSTGSQQWVLAGRDAFRLWLRRKANYSIPRWCSSDMWYLLGRFRLTQRRPWAVQNFPVLTTRKSPEWFLLMAGWYHQFVANLSRMAEPLHGGGRDILQLQSTSYRKEKHTLPQNWNFWHWFGLWRSREYTWMATFSPLWQTIPLCSICQDHQTKHQSNQVHPHATWIHVHCGL